MITAVDKTTDDSCRKN